MMKNLSWIFLLILVTSASCTESENHGADEIVIEYFNKYEKEGINNAFNYLFGTNKWINQNDSSVLGLRKQLISLLPELGNYYGYELVAKRSLGADYSLYSVMTQYERQPLRYTFIIYSINGESRIQKFKFDLDYDYELEKASEAYFLKENY